METAIGYLRVSTNEQATTGQSLEDQRAKLLAYADLYDIELVEVIVDAGESAKSLKRPGLQRVLSMLRSGAADGLVVAKLDRLTRSIADWQVLIDKYFGERAGKQLFSVADSIDTRTAAGRMVLNMLLTVSQWEREAIGERTKAVMQYKRRKGERVGTVPFGFDVASDGVNLIENESEQEALQLIGELRESGHSLRAIAAELTRRNVPSKRGAEWKHTTIQRIVARAA